MLETQRGGMEGLAGAEGEAVLDELFILGVDGALADFGAAVALVVEEGMTGHGHVDADLVRPTGLELAFDDRNVAVALEYAVVRDGPFALLGVVVVAEAQAVVGVAADVAGEGAAILDDIAPYDGDVFPFNGMDEELFGEFQLGLVVLGDHEEAARVLVDAVHEHTHPLVGTGLVGGLGPAEMEGQGVDEGAAIVAVAGVDHHAGGFVDHQQVLVLIDDVEGNVLGEDLHAAALVGHHEADDVAGTDDRVGLGEFVIDEDIAHLDGELDAVAGGVLGMGGDVFVDPDGGLPLVGDETEMLEKGRLLAFGAVLFGLGQVEEFF